MYSSEQLSLKADEKQTVKIEIEDMPDSENIKLTLIESINNPKPLCAAVTVK